MTKPQRVMIGLQLSRAFMAKHHYQWLPRAVIALWCDCTPEAIRQIEERGLRKIARYGVFQREDLDWPCSIVSRHYRREV